jgi:hypothetical protein
MCFSQLLTGDKMLLQSSFFYVEQCELFSDRLTGMTPD